MTRTTVAIRHRRRQMLCCSMRYATANDALLRVMAPMSQLSDDVISLSPYDNRTQWRIQKLTVP